MKITFDFFALTISKGVNTPLLLLETMLIARVLGPEGFGQWSLMFAAATLLHNVLISWTYPVTIKFGCQEWVQQQSLSQTLSTRSPIVLIGMCLCLLLLYLQPINWLTYFYSTDPKLAWLVFFYILSLWLTFETQSILQASNSFISQSLIMPLITCSSIIFLSATLMSVGQSNLITIAIGVLFIRCIIWTSTWIFSITKSNFHWQLPTFNSIKQALYFGWPLIPTLMLGYLSDWGDHILLGLYCSTSEVGLWGITYQIMQGIISINSILMTILLPWLIKRNQIVKQSDKFYLERVLPTILSLWLLAIIIVVMFIPVIFTLFLGKKFEDAQALALVLNLGIFTSVFSSLYGILFTLQDRLYAVLIYNFVIVIINLSLSLLLIPKIGVMGAAIGTIGSYLIGQLLYVIDQHHFLKVSLFKISVLFSMILFIGLLQYFAGADAWLRLLCCLVCLLLLMMTIRKINSIEPMLIIKFFTGILNPIGFLLNRTLVSTSINE